MFGVLALVPVSMFTADIVRALRKPGGDTVSARITEVVRDWGGGATVTPISPVYTSHEVGYQLKDSGTLACAPAPVGVIEGSRAEVSFMAGLLMDKFSYHIPFYRQYQRAADAGLRLSRP